MFSISEYPRNRQFWRARWYQGGGAAGNPWRPLFLRKIL